MKGEESTQALSDLHGCVLLLHPFRGEGIVSELRLLAEASSKHSADLSPLLDRNSITFQLRPTNGSLYDKCARVCACVCLCF